MDKNELLANGGHVTELMIKQAYVVGWTNVMFIIFALSMWCWCFMAVKRKMTPPPANEKIGYLRAELEGDDAQSVCAILAVTFVLIVACVLLVAADTITALTNPEYWVMMRR
jgi:hypothetical protein